MELQNHHPFKYHKPRASGKSYSCRFLLIKQKKKKHVYEFSAQTFDASFWSGSILSEGKWLVSGKEPTSQLLWKLCIIHLINPAWVLLTDLIGIFQSFILESPKTGVGLFFLCSLYFPLFCMDEILQMYAQTADTYIAYC